MASAAVKALSSWGFISIALLSASATVERVRQSASHLGVNQVEVHRSQREKGEEREKKGISPVVEGRESEQEI